MMRRAVAAVCLFLTGCVTIDDQLLIDCDTRDRDVVRLTASTQLSSDTPRNDAVRARLSETRELLLSGLDPWSQRFARAAPLTERQTWDRNAGVLTRAEHSGTIAADSLQRFFGDLPVTVQLTRAEGYGELTIYAGASTRATRAQREHFTRTLEVWSAAASRYFIAVHHLYDYLNANPQRARNAFTQLFADDETVVALNDEEAALITAVRAAMSELSEWERSEEKESYTIAEEADLVLNPFPAEITVHTGGEITAMEGFVKRDSQRVAIPRPSLLDALASLEGKWIAPDPFAAAIKADKDPVNVDALAAAPRKSLPLVPPPEIAAALSGAMKPAPRYRVRWVERPRRD